MRKTNLDTRTITKVIGILLIVLAIMMLSNLLIEKTIATLSASKKSLPIYCVETDEKKVAISFDAAWGNDDTDVLLSILDEYNVKTTFFLVKMWVDKYPEDVKKMIAAGHDIGNHSSTHPHMSKLSEEGIKKELMDAHDAVKNLTGYEMDLFRPPFGDYNDKLVDTAKDCGYYTIQWDVDSLDWKEYGADHEVKTVLQHKALGNGSIILFHNDAKYTPEALPAILKGLQDEGYEIVPISEIIIRDDYYMDHTGRQMKKE
ncbi:polysaccharide deacetylase family protein [Vallitalea pronyensis]|uniref:Polysaccharide deacetylase family protein n=1 Tax=Vallitalea pronyensis TaxID=1348613 RepID=A0A8J8MI83_9FIRM|nr:polysaccharide deacetylase family protein [Vallitalea pronyensis]QUI22011.1 polysaccharide deacetylase family protein [Vallitalea pronyensis]